jgi:hypothetical protein
MLLSLSPMMAGLHGPANGLGMLEYAVRIALGKVISLRRPRSRSASERLTTAIFFPVTSLAFLAL